MERTGDSANGPRDRVDVIVEMVKRGGEGRLDPTWELRACRYLLLLHRVDLRRTMPLTFAASGKCHSVLHTKNRPALVRPSQSLGDTPGLASKSGPGSFNLGKWDPNMEGSRLRTAGGVRVGFQPRRNLIWSTNFYHKRHLNRYNRAHPHDSGCSSRPARRTNQNGICPYHHLTFFFCPFSSDQSPVISLSNQNDT
jgi:hypothetical protein